MKNVLSVVLYLFVISLGSNVMAEKPTGWQDYYWGLTPYDFEGVEGVETLNNPVIENVRGEMLYAKFVKKNYRIAGIPYSVLFFFDHQDRFSAYKLIYSSSDPTIEAAYRELLRLLGEKYSPSFPVPEDVRNRVFHFSQGHIKVEFTDQTENGLPTISVLYLDDNSEELDKL